MNSGNLNFLEPSGPLQACNGTALPSIFFIQLLLFSFPVIYFPYSVSLSSLTLSFRLHYGPEVDSVSCGVKAAGAYHNLAISIRRLSIHSGKLNLLDCSRPAQAFIRLVYPYLYFYSNPPPCSSFDISSLLIPPCPSVFLVPFCHTFIPLTFVYLLVFLPQQTSSVLLFHNNKLMVYMYIVRNTTIFLIVRLLLIRYNYMFRPSMLAIFRLYIRHLMISYSYT